MAALAVAHARNELSSGYCLALKSLMSSCVFKQTPTVVAIDFDAPVCCIVLVNNTSCFALSYAISVLVSVKLRASDILSAGSKQCCLHAILSWNWLPSNALCNHFAAELSTTNLAASTQQSRRNIVSTSSEMGWRCSSGIEVQPTMCDIIRSSAATCNAGLELPCGQQYTNFTACDV
eukprot:4613-Heterococcus_DN1.PRE.2